ncbi:MAG: hypothetical protein KC897_00555 [Candidatus Omnitrophica bacterium]|nr:hypothetical protein [Candidatus Omnitrophota bacterium]MCB9719941.1 hypothetical protein [Candidatus Omnitrophota bacterium]
MPRGKIQEYYPERGCGCILDSVSNRTITVYANYFYLQRGQVVEAGQDVDYDILSNRGEDMAINVRILDKEGQAES